MVKGRRLVLIVAAITIGIALRFWNLDLKPLWMDEVITAIFSLGRSYQNVPLNQALPVSAFEQIFRLRPEATCAEIADIVTTQSVHPPFFFCWMHDWLRWTETVPLSWVWKLRALPALFGVLAIGAMYQLNRLLFSRSAAWSGAAVIAVSPFAVYLSQEARHYTLPIVLITLALLGLYQLHLDIYHRQFRPWVWLGWILVNGIGFYVHYFFLLAFTSQSLTLILNAFWLFNHKAAATEPLTLDPAALPDPGLVHQSPRLKWTFFAGAIGAAIATVLLIYLPWMPIFLRHMVRPETDWMNTVPDDWQNLVSPLYQLSLSWIVMVIALPVETQSLVINGISALAMVLFTGWLLWRLWPGFKQLWYSPQTHLPTRMLVIFILTVVLQFLAIVYLLGKDITQAPRYSFIYFPAVCALLGAGLSLPSIQPERGFNRRVGLLSRLNPIVALLLVGLLSSSFVVTNFVFQKPYLPEQIVQTLRFEPGQKLLVAMGYGNWQHVALGLSFALELNRQHPLEMPTPARQTDRSIDPEPVFVFVKRSQMWEQLAKIVTSTPSSLHLWVFGPGLRRQDYPSSIPDSPKGKTSTLCQIDREKHDRVGVPYQLYRC